MDLDILIPIFWTVVFGGLVVFSFSRLSKKPPTTKKWVRPEKVDQKKPED
tara:strand:- start:121 stop:270 length:150 start_codon:yes stop_codon:yes gene_type:complete